ncbi:hypothetical protein ACOKW7_14280 [Limnospira platensis CENA597]|uniref:hypothetical protein n=1 Tax=Limnospira platensis TaxID=118562 RepID=UPI003DA0DE32
MSSRQTRSSIGRNGVRQVNLAQRTSTQEMGWFGKLWAKITGKVVEWGKSFGGWLWEGITKFLSNFSFEKVARFITSNWDSFWNFNWNISDEQIDKNMMNIANQFISTTAGFLGNMAGKLVCGVLPVAGLAFINKAAAMHIALSKGPEMLMEVSTAFGAYVKQSFNMAMKAIAWQLFKHGRRVVKMFLDKSPSTLATAIVSMVPGGKDTIKKWGDEKGEEWSFGKQKREAREKLPEKYDGKLSTIWNQDSSEEFWDEFSDNCKEAIILVAQGLDEYIALQRIEENRQQQLVNAVVENGGERFRLVSSLRNLQENVANTLAQTEILGNRDIGQFVGSGDISEVPNSSNLKIQLTFILYNYEKPPYWTKERRSKLQKTQIELPSVERHEITWDKLQRIFTQPSKSAFTKGNIKVTCNMRNGRTFSFFVNESSKSDAERICKDLVQLTNSSIVYPLLFEERKGFGGRENAKRIKESKMYISEVKILNWELIDKFEQAKIDMGENSVLAMYKDPRKSKVKIPLHFENKPKWVDDAIRTATRTSLEMKTGNQPPTTA